MIESRGKYTQHHPVVGGQGRAADYISPRKVALFIKLFDDVCDNVGGYRKAVQEIGIPDHVVPGMRVRKKLSTLQARRILDCHNRLIGKKNE